MDKRLIWADIIRIMAVYLIVALHVVSVPNYSQASFIFDMGLVLTYTCVPLLVMLSGALLLGKQESYRIFLFKRMSRVVLPWITWTVIFTCIALYFQADFNLIRFIHTFHMIFIPFFWFIVLICSLYTITPALRIFVQAAKTKDILIAILIWFIALSLLPYIRDTDAFPLKVGNGIVQLVVNFIGYFLLGHVIVRLHLKKKLLPIFLIIFFISFVVRSWLEYYYLHGHPQLLSGSASLDPIFIIVASSLFISLHLGEDFYRRILNKSTRTVLRTISNATLGIYFVHYLFLNRAPLPMFISTPSLIHVSWESDMFINAFILFMVSLVIILVLQRIPLIKYFIT